TKMFTNQFIEENYIGEDVITFPFDCLPNELKTHVIQYMSLKERANIGSIGNLHELVRIAGFNRFSSVNFNSISQPVISACDETTEEKDVQDKECSQFFKHATTSVLTIKGRMNDESESSIKSAFKSLSFKELEISFSNDYSGRIMSEFLQGRKGIDEVRIH
ncbi:hypothetical protein PMAYCL1PPCAC_23163, partial [Pristionchus mayeri]